ncbi:MAG: hypothetical protein ACTS40_02190, partial [Candidatus Hodgkinia cicadicola]
FSWNFVPKGFNVSLQPPSAPPRLTLRRTIEGETAEAVSLTSSAAAYERYQRTKRKLRWRDESHLPKAKFGNFFPASADALLQCNRLGECHRRLWTTYPNLRRSNNPSE